MRKVLTVLALLATANLLWPCWAFSLPRKERRVVLIVAHGATLEDIAADNLPNFRRLLSIGAIGLMNVRTAGGPVGPAKSDTETEPGCLTLGAGSRSIAGNEARQAYNSDELIDGVAAAKLYQRFFLTRPPNGSVVMVTANEIQHNNADLPYRLEAGLLGQTLRKAGLLTACVGNSDTLADRHREAAAIVMDSEGIIDKGNVNRSVLRRNPRAPYDVQTSAIELIRHFDAAVGSANLVVVDTGDMARADWYGDNCLRGQAIAMRRWAAEHTDFLIGQIISRLDLRSSRIIFLSPSSPKWKPYSNRRMAPIVMVGEGIANGLITSGSTRRPGIIANTDLAPDIIQYFGVAVPPSVIGRPLGSSPLSNPIASLRKLDYELTQQNSRLALMRLMATVLTIVVILGTLLRTKSGIAPKLALIPAMAVPLMALLPIFGSYDVTTTGVILAGAGIVFLLPVILTRARNETALIALAFALCVIVFADLLLGGYLLANSPFSYSPTEGARYYGVGNEIMGALVAAATITILGLIGPRIESMRGLRHLRILLCLAFFLGLALAIGAPNLGANTGGALAALGASGAALAVLASGHMTARKWTLAAVVPLGIFTFLIAADRLRGAGGESHLARAFASVTGGGAAEFGLIIVRKVGMNLKLLQSSAWSKLLIACAGALVYLRATAPMFKRPEWSRQAIKVIAIGALAALVLNDSGVVAAATCVVYAWSLEMMADSRVKG